MTYLHANPQLVHLHKTAKEEIDAVDDVATLSRQRIAELKRGIPFVIRASVGQHILDHLDEIVTQKETSSGMLNTLAHVNKVLQDHLAGERLCLDAHASCDDHHVPTR